MSFPLSESYPVIGCDRTYLAENRLGDRVLFLATIRVLANSICVSTSFALQYPLILRQLSFSLSLSLTLSDVHNKKRMFF